MNDFYGKKLDYWRKESTIVHSKPKEHTHMANSYVKNDVHIIFHVKSASVKIRKEDFQPVVQYIGGTIKGIGGTPFIIGGTGDHIHILTSVPPTRTLSVFVQNIKAESSRWIKTLDVHYRHFAWQEGYGAFSVSPSLIEKTVTYIQGQEEHHRKHTFQEEYKAFLDAYGIEYDERYMVD
jgi:REP element-mobilizing transposase RayT